MMILNVDHIQLIIDAIGLGQGMIFSQDSIRWDDVKDADLTAHFLIGFLLFQPIAAGHLAAAEADDV